MQMSYLFGDLTVAEESARSLAPFLPVFRSLFLRVDYFFYRSLVLAARFEETALAERDALLGEMEDALKRLQTWAENAPDNWSHKRDLLAAEMARISGRASEALAFYQKAIERAGKEKFRQDEALAHELCGRFHAARSEKRMATLHFAAAVDGYAAWGAAAKIEQLRQWREAPLAAPIAPRLTPNLAVGPALDQASLVKVIETLTGELNLDRLLEKVIRICGEAASSERAVLVLNDGGLVVRAVANS